MRIETPQPLRTRPTVSVVVPCYNYGRFLPAAVRSAFEGNDAVDVDVIVVDDCSTDDSLEVARSLARADARVRVVEHEVNQGHIRTYNDGLSRARGDYVVLLSADDLLTPGSLARSAALMERHPQVGLVYGYARSFAISPVASSPRVRNWSVYDGAEWLSLSARRGRCFLVSPEAMMRRGALEAAGEYDPRLPHSADFAMWLRVAVTFDVGRVNGPVQADYRVHDQNMHLTEFAGWLTDLDERLKTFDLFFEECGDELANATELHARARRALAREALRRGVSAGREQDEGARGYLQFAQRADPALCRTVRGRLARRVVVRGVREPVASAWGFAERIEHHLRWRRERRYGT